MIEAGTGTNTAVLLTEEVIRRIAAFSFAMVDSSERSGFVAWVGNTDLSRKVDYHGSPETFAYNFVNTAADLGRDTLIKVLRTHREHSGVDKQPECDDLIRIVEAAPLRNTRRLAMTLTAADRELLAGKIAPYVTNDASITALLVECGFPSDFHFRVGRTNIPLDFATNLIAACEQAGAFNNRSAVATLAKTVAARYGEPSRGQLLALAARSDADDKQATTPVSMEKINMTETTTASNIIETTPSVFICYSHKDSEIVERIKVHLKPIIRNGRIEIFQDTQIKPGQVWRNEISNALDRASAAILLVSPDFVASDFIDEQEWPKILVATKERGLTVFWLKLKACLTDEVEGLEELQAVHDTGKTLDMLTEPERNNIYDALARSVREQIIKRGGADPK